MQFSGFIEASNKSTGADEVFDLLCQATCPLGYDKVGFFVLNGAISNGPVRLEADSGPIIVSNYSDNFLRSYAKDRRHEIDPLLSMARDNLTPLVWEDVVGRMKLSEDQMILCRERLDAGIHDEVSCPRSRTRRTCIRGPIRTRHAWTVRSQPPQCAPGIGNPFLLCVHETPTNSY